MAGLVQNRRSTKFPSFSLYSDRQFASTPGLGEKGLLSRADSDGLHVLQVWGLSEVAHLVSDTVGIVFSQGFLEVRSEDAV